MLANRFLDSKVKRLNSKQAVMSPNSTRKRFSSLCSPSNNVQPANCVFCEKERLTNSNSFALLLKKALFTKYSSAQNYYYVSDINDILNGVSTHKVVYYRDLEYVISELEYLKRSYNNQECQSKMVGLSEYYKYHRDIPRLFMQKVYLTINKFHEIKRKLDYAAVKRRLKIIDDEASSTLRVNKRNPSYGDLKPEELLHLLKDLKLDKSSRIEMSSTIHLKEIVTLMGSDNHIDYSITTFLFNEQKPDFNKLQQINLDDLPLNSRRTTSSARRIPQTQRSMQDTPSPQKGQLITLQKQVEGFANFVQNQKLKFSKQLSDQKLKQNDFQLKLPSRQSSKSKQPELLASQINFLKEKVVSQLQLSSKKSPPQSTERTEKQSIDVIKHKINSFVPDSGKPFAKIPSYALASLKSLQLKQFESKKPDIKPQVQITLVKHNRTKSTDHFSNNYKVSPPKFHENPLKNNITSQGPNKKSVYNINQNNIINIYIEDMKSSAKLKGSQTTRVCNYEQFKSDQKK